MMTASEQIRELRLSMFEGSWGCGAYTDGEYSANHPSDLEGASKANCILSHLAVISGANHWSDVDMSAREAVKCLADAIRQEHGSRIEYDLEAVWAFNDGLGRTFDEIVHVTDVAEKLAQEKEQANG